MSADRDQIKVDITIYHLGAAINDLCDFADNRRLSPLVSRERDKIATMAGQLSDLIASLNRTIMEAAE